ncbi:hypothetical protein HD806DRAFT_519509 [Xylariaceae sp. AK1471]|nr:hypothetical protein HD806DRAFT_519509 [Xylariaceae sp. AK1471]
MADNSHDGRRSQRSHGNTHRDNTSRNQRQRLQPSETSVTLACQLCGDLLSAPEGGLPAYCGRPECQQTALVDEAEARDPPHASTYCQDGQLYGNQAPFATAPGYQPVPYRTPRSSNWMPNQDIRSPTIPSLRDIEALRENLSPSGTATLSLRSAQDIQEDLNPSQTSGHTSIGAYHGSSAVQFARPEYTYQYSGASGQLSHGSHHYYGQGHDEGNGK